MDDNTKYDFKSGDIAYRKSDNMHLYCYVEDYANNCWRYKPGPGQLTIPGNIVGSKERRLLLLSNPFKINVGQTNYRGSTVIVFVHTVHVVEVFHFATGQKLFVIADGLIKSDK